jgi:hypothetical protein
MIKFMCAQSCFHHNVFPALNDVCIRCYFSHKTSWVFNIFTVLDYIITVLCVVPHHSTSTQLQSSSYTIRIVENVI